jgi:hypothetical protein
MDHSARLTALLKTFVGAPAPLSRLALSLEKDALVWTSAKGSGRWTFDKAADELKSSPADALFVLPRSVALARVQELPSIQKDELRAMARLQAVRDLPFPEDELACGHVVLSQDAARGVSRVLLVIAQAERLAPWATAASRVRLASISYIPRPLALLTHTRSQAAAPTDYLQLDWKDGWAGLDVVSGGVLSLTRSLPAANVTPEWAAREVTNTLRMAGRPTSDLPVVVSGDWPLAGETLDASLRTLGVPAVHRFPADSQDPALFGALRAPADSATRLSGSGAAQAESATLTWNRWTRPLRWVGVFAASLLLFAVAQTATKYRALAQLDRRLAAAQGQDRLSSAMAEELAARERFSRARPTPLDVLHELHRLLPPGLRIEQFLYESDGGLLLRGKAPGLGQVMTSVQALERAKSVTRVRLESSRASGGGATFQIRASVVSRTPQEGATR